MAAPNNRVAKLANALTEELAKAQRDNEALLQRNEDLVRQIADAQERAEIAESRAREAEQKRMALELIATEQYKSVVAWLFEDPSRKAAKLTVSWAIVSILVGLGATVYSVWHSARLSVESSVQQRREISELVEAPLTRRIAESEKNVTDSISRDNVRSNQWLEQSNQRLEQNIAAGFEQVVAGFAKPSSMSVPELQRNSTLLRTISFGDDSYFRVSAPPGSEKLRIGLISLSGNADLYFRYGTLPLPTDRAPDLICRSEAIAQGDDVCLTTDAPVPGDWFIRVHGTARGFSAYQLQVTSVRPPRTSTPRKRK